MFPITKGWLPIFFIFLLCRGTKGTAPKMWPEYAEIFVNEGESLQLNCEGTKEIKFYYPDIMTQDGNLTSPHVMESRDYGRKISFLRPYVVHGDTGWYGCANSDVKVTANHYDQPEVNWKYVWVNSSTNWFVRSDMQMISAIAGVAITIPCRPTLPDYKVALTNLESTEDIDHPFDPKIGFIVEKVRLHDSGLFTCKITHNYDTQEAKTYLRVIKPSALPKASPTIINDTLRHVTKGQDLVVKCTLDIDASIPTYTFNWTVPQQDGRFKTTTEFVASAAGPRMKTLITLLTINDVKYEDAGEYECFFKTDIGEGQWHHKNTKTYITVYDPANTYINLTLDGENQIFERDSGDDVQWVVSVDAYPPATLQWFDPNNKTIEDSSDSMRSNVIVKTSPTSTTLKIKHVQLRHRGMYSLHAFNKKDEKILNITLIVKSAPIVEISSNAEDYYMLNEEVKIYFQAYAYPSPEVICSFRSSVTNKFTPLNFTRKPTDFADLITTTMIATDSGYVNCTACNILDCDYQIEPIFVTDVPDGFGIIEANPELTAGDDLNVICAGSIYNYTNIEWLDENKNPLQQSDRIKIVNRQTRFTNRSELHINKVQNSDNGTNYICRGTNDDNFLNLKRYEIKIFVPQKPIIWQTNLNETEINLDLSTEGHKTFELKCRAKGMPSPNVTWYKDDIKIEPSEQYIFDDKNQELHIKYLLEENSGKYKCKSENRVGVDEKWMTLTIIGKGIPKKLIICIAILVVVCVVLVIYFSIKMHREKVMRKQLMEAGLTHFEEGALECLNPELTVDDQAELLPYDKKWEFPRERLKFGKQLGFGAFGVVMKAEARGICDEETVTTVAVKMVRRSTESTYIRALASELKIMVHLGKHLNVVNLLGACTKNITKRELLVIVEYCRFGNLHNYLLRHRADFINQIDPVTGKIDPTIGLDKLTRTTSVGSNNRISANSCNSSPAAELVSYTAGTDSQNVSMSPDGCVLSNNSTQPGWRSNYSGDYKDQNLKPICTQDLLSWAFQVARGMEYLSQRKVLHGDLAARNILLAEDNIVKICDFGLAKTMYKDDNYKKKGDAPLPIKWMAIESIRDRVFSTQSDIWSFGIVLWEFFTLAKTPYPGMEAEKQYQRLIEGYRMEQPEYATEDVYDIMLQCWKAKPTLRPTFTNLVANIGELLEEGVKEHYVDLNAPYLNMNTTILESGKNDYLTMMSAPDHDALSSPNSLYVNTPYNSPEGEIPEESYLPMSPSSVGSESGIFSPRLTSNNGNFDFSMSEKTANINSDSESEAVEISPMLTRAKEEEEEEEEDNYLKPINVHERRAEFARQRKALKEAEKIERERKTDSGYCNAPQNLHLIDLNEANLQKNQIDGMKKMEDVNVGKNVKDSPSSIIRTQDNYVNMPKQKDNLRKDGSVSFSNPSYVMMGNRNFEQPEV